MIAQGGRLPAEATRFFGRSVEAAAVKGALAGSRLVTLTGPGGVGKTRLALKVARERAREYPDGVFLADLSPAGDGLGVLRAVASATGLPAQSGVGDEHGDGAPLPALLGQRKLLLILDTAEHVLDACAGVADALLSGGDGPSLLVTSRQPLDLPGEVVFRVAPLPVADDGGEAVALLADRTAAATGSDPFAVTADMVPGLVRLCRQLDGLPLALELAAPRLRAVGLDELLARLPGQLRLLAGGRRTVAGDRFRSLTASVAWSHALCSPDEQRLWAALSVFADGFDLPAAEAVGAAAAPPAPAVPPGAGPPGDGGSGVLGALVGLVDKSVVLRVADAGGAGRYRLLAAAREYGAARADGASAGRHRRHYLARARAVAADFIGPDQLRLVDQLGRDEANLRLALDDAITAGDAATADGLTVDCWPWLVSTGHLAQARAWLTRAPAGASARHHQSSARRPSARRDAAPARPPASARAPFPLAAGPASAAASAPDSRALLAWVLSAQGDLAAADALRGQAARPGGPPVPGGQALPPGRGGPAALDEGRLTRPDGKRLATVVAELTDALTALRRGAFDDCGRRCAALATSLPDGERWARGWASWAAGVAAWCGGRAAAAGPALRTGLELLAPFGDEFAVAQHLEALAWIAAKRGDGRRAARLQGAADRRWAELVAAGEVRARRCGLLVLDVERDQAERRARDDLGAAGYAAEYGAGAGLRTVGAVSLALPGLASPYRTGEAERASWRGPDAHERALAALAAAPAPDQGERSQEATDAGEAPLTASPDPGPGDGQAPGDGQETASTAPARHWELLTTREREVALLVAAGLTNKDIAARLVVSKRTVDAHVEHILGKLGYTSRVQVAALASQAQASGARLGATPPGRPQNGGAGPSRAPGGARPRAARPDSNPVPGG